MPLNSLRRILELNPASASQLPASVAVGLALPAAILGIVLIGMDLHLPGMVAWTAAIVMTGVALRGIYTAGVIGALALCGVMLWQLMLGGAAILSRSEQMSLLLLTVLAAVVGRFIARDMQQRVDANAVQSRLDILSTTIESILDASRDCIKVLGTDGSILSINAPGLKLIGAESAGQIVGKNWFSLWGAEHQKPLSAAWHQALTRGHSQFEGSCRILTGDRRTWVNTFTLVRTPQQGDAHVICISCDVTDSINLQQTISSSMAQLTSLLNHIDDASFAVDNNWTIRFANQSGEQLSARLERPHATGRSLWEIFPFQPGEPASILIRRAMEEKNTQYCEYYFAPQQCWLGITASAAANGISILARDITGLKQTQKISAEEAARLQVAHEIAGFGDWGFDYDQGAMHFSPRAVAMLEMEDCPAHEYKKYLLDKLKPRDRMALVQSIVNCTEAEPTIDLIVSFPGREGIDRHVHWIGRLLTDESGNAERMLGAMQDVSVHLNAQYSLEQARSLVRDLVDALPMQIMVIDSEGQLVVANRTWVNSRKRHYRGEERPENFFEINDGDENSRPITARAQQAVRAILSGSEASIDYEYTVNRGGKVQHFLVQVRPFRNNETLLAVLVHHETTALRRASDTASAGGHTMYQRGENLSLLQRDTSSPEHR